MYKLQTQLEYFRYNSFINIGKINVTWFVLDNDEEDDETGRCFTQDELNQFVNFTLNNLHNFPGAKNYHLSNDDEAPYCNIYSALENERLIRPKNVIIRRNPQISRNGITECMDIILTNEQGTDKHVYELPFNVIGKIE